MFDTSVRGISIGDTCLTFSPVPRGASAGLTGFWHGFPFPPTGLFRVDFASGDLFLPFELIRRVYCMINFIYFARHAFQ